MTKQMTLYSPTRNRDSMIREMAAADTPRERLLRSGAQSLSDPELVSLMLSGGADGSKLVKRTRELLAKVGGVADLVGSGAAVLRSLGLSRSRVAILLAAVELARRLAQGDMCEREPLSRPEVVARHLYLRYRVNGQEIMGALYLDTRNRLVGESQVFRGTLSRAAVEPGPLLREGLMRCAAGLVLFHTHPSGDPSPSAEDLSFTRRLAEAGETVGIRLVDHLILGSGRRWVSLRQRGGW